MRVALVHDWLNTKFGGAERVLAQLTEIYPEAPIYTLLFDPVAVGDRIDHDRIKPSVLQRAPGFLRRRSRYLLPFIPSAIEQFDLTDYDLVISSSSAFAKGVITRPETMHICYCHTPMRFVWDYWPGYVQEQHVGSIRKAAIHRLTSKLRLWDYYSAARVDAWIANSHTTAGRIKKYYHQDVAAVINPGVDTEAFTHSATGKDDYFVTLAALTPYKKIDLAIEACNQLSQRLLVIGEGPDRPRLQKLAGPTVSFVGRVDDEERVRLVGNAAALLFPNEEDFGIAPVEAMAAGTPVVGYNRGGLTETITPGKTGILFDQQTAEGLAEAIKSFRPAQFKTSDLVVAAAKFDEEHFAKNFTKEVEQLYGRFQKA